MNLDFQALNSSWWMIGLGLYVYVHSLAVPRCRLKSEVMWLPFLLCLKYPHGPQCLEHNPSEEKY